VRPRIVVTSLALIAILVAVVVPGPVGSRVPSPDATTDAGLFRNVEISALARGTAMTIKPQDPGARSAGRLDRSTTIVDPASSAQAPLAPIRRAQRTPRVGTVSKNPWRVDPDISWYGPRFYGNGTACGQKLTKTLVGVAHKTLPCGSLVTFRHKGIMLTVPVIDRGPYVAGRIFDLSNGACRILNHCFTGSIEYRIGQ